MITASALGRVIACPGSETFQHVRKQTEYSTMGDSRHKYLELVGSLGPEKALEHIPEEHREMCEAIDLTGLPTKLASEVAFSWNWKTGKARELGRGIGRDYSNCGPHEIAGTIDALGIAKDSLYIGDYKGFELVKAKDNAQLLFAAMCASKVYAKDVATLEIINVRGSSNWRSKATVDAFDLFDFESKLRTTIQIVEALKTGATVTPTVVEGPHCKYCPAFDSCPAKTQLMRAMVNGDEATRVEMTVPLSPETATLAYQQLRAMEALTKRAREIVYAYAAERPIDLGDGKVFGSRVKEGNESLDGDVTYEVIREQLGQEAADIAVTRTATKSGIAKAVAAAKPAGTKKAAIESVLVAVRARDGAKRKTSTTVDEHRKELTA